MGNSSPKKSVFKPIPQIHGHSDLSLDGGATVSDIVNRFAELEIPYGTLTEHGNMNSAMELYQSCQKKGIKPILGIEAYVEDEWSEPEYFQSGKKKGEKKRKYVHLTIHFKNNTAYEYFCNLTRKMEENAIVTAFGERKPTMKLEDLYAIRDHITLGCGCFMPGTVVPTLNGRKKIEELQPNDMVLNRFGKFQSIALPTETLYDGEIVEIDTQHLFDKIQATADHQFLVLTGFGQMEYKEAKDLNKNDILVFPNPPELVGDTMYVYNFQSTQKSFNRCVRIDLADHETAWALGIFIAEGNFGTHRQDENPGYFEINMHSIKDAHHLERFKKWAINSGATSVKISNRKGLGGNCKVFSAPLTGWLMSLFGGRVHADTKFIPSRIKHIPLEFQISFLRGYLDGDGSFACRSYNHKKSGPYTKRSQAVATISKNLAEDVSELLRKLNTSYSTVVVPAKIRHGMNKRTTYYIQLSGSEALKLWDILNGNLKLTHNKYFYSKIGKIVKSQYRGSVYCAVMKGDPSLVVGSGIAVHNCLVGVVSKHLLKGNTDLAKKMYSIIREIPKEGSFFVEVFPHEVTHNWKGPKYEPKTNKLLEKGFFYKNECTAFAPDGDLQKSVNKFVIELAEQYGDPVVPSLDFHMAKPEQKAVQDARLGQGREQWKFYNTYDIKPQDEVGEFFMKTHGISSKTFEKWVDNAYLWASNFNDFKIPTSKDRWILPEFQGDSLIWIKKVIDKVGRMNWNDPVMMDRLKTEIHTLKFNGKLDVLPYFAPIVDLTNWCDQQGILYNLRGSASGSLLVYLLGISGVDPIKHGLSFERFINEGRIKANTLPDADVDIGERDKVIEYLKGKYGDKIMQLSVDVKSKIKVAIKDAERYVKGSVSEETEAICRSIPNPPQGADEHGYVFGYEDDEGTHHAGVLETNEKLQEFAQKNPDVWNYATQMLGIIRNKGSHACAFVITDRPVTNYVPVFSVSGEMVTAFSPKGIEDAGLIKYDILGVNTLNDVGRCLKLIKDKRGIHLDINNLPDDPEVYKEFARGNTETVFQFNTATVIPFLMKLKPKSIEELSNITALARPGTLDAPSGDGRTLADVYVARARKEEDLAYIHPDLEPILKNTYGVQLYQEIQIQIFKDLAGYTAQEAESVRRGIGKKDEKILNEAIGRLKKSCLARGWSEAQVALLADQIFAAARYSFNKSHAVSYAKLGYACQYLKTKYPIEWWCAVLSNSSKTEISTFWPHCGDFVLLPDINQSGDGWEIHGDKIRAPISILNGIGDAAYAQIMALKPYTDIRDFVFKHKQNSSRAVHKGVICKLIASGVMDSLFPADTALNDKLFSYMSLKAEAEGVNKIDEVPAEYLPQNSLEKFCMVKDLIPVVSMDLRPYILPSMGIPAPENTLGVWRHVTNHPYRKGEKVAQSYVNGPMLSKIVDIFGRDPRMGTGLGQIITLSYVIEEKTQAYSGKSKQMTKVLIDTGGTFQEAVVWPKYGESIAETGFKGKICKIGWKYNDKRRELMVSFVEPLDVSKFKV